RSPWWAVAATTPPRPTVRLTPASARTTSSARSAARNRLTTRGEAAAAADLPSPAAGLVSSAMPDGLLFAVLAIGEPGHEGVEDRKRGHHERWSICTPVGLLGVHDTEMGT